MGGMGQDREESQGFFEMLWDCDHCDARGLLGKSQRHCANCGAPQNPGKRYFPQPGEQRRVDGHVYEGADRTCPACSAPQSARANNCTHCGSVLDGAAEVRGVDDAAAARPTPARPRRRRIWPFVLVVLAVAAAAIWARCLRSHQAEVTVGAHRWTRVVAIEEFDERSEEAWRSEVPIDAGFPLCHERQRGSRQIEDGEDCKLERRDRKDGTFEQVKKCKPKYRSEPVMDSWCRFTARRWKPAGAGARESGTGLSPVWPTNLPPADAPAQLGARRQAGRTETLTLDFPGHGSCDVADAVWRKYADGQKVKAEVRASSDEVVCGSL